MKKSLIIIALVLLNSSMFLPGWQASAQSPENMSYQAVIRDGSGNLLSNQIVGMQISILQTSTTGKVVYTEAQTPITNVNGLVSIVIGKEPGFDTINWANGPYFIKTETDPTGSTNYTISGTSQLLSVPYALHAKTAESIEGAHYHGEEFEGGIIFYIYKGSDGADHGLIVSKTEGSAIWGSLNLIGADRRSDGVFNTNLMSADPGTAREWVESLGTGWYLPSIDELILLRQNRFHVNNSTASGLTLIESEYYWSSTEVSATHGSYMSFLYNTTSSNLKDFPLYVRAIRAF